MEPSDAIMARFLAPAPQADRPLARPYRGVCWQRSAIRRSGCRRSSMSPAPTARARPWLHAGDARGGGPASCMSTPRRTWCVSMSASGSARRRRAPGRRGRAGRRAGAASRPMRAADHLLRDHHGGRVPALRRASRPTCCSSRSGLGGRLDATNVIDSPWPRSSRRSRSTMRISSATRSTEIAAEKAGILKRGAPASSAAGAARRWR